MQVKILFGLLVLWMMGNRTLLAQEKPEDKTLSPYFFVKSKNSDVDQMPLKHTAADVSIAGVIADVKVTQVYENEGKNTLEAIYVFPGSTRAAVYAMTMTIGDRKLVAKIEEKQKAREAYETAKEEGKTASLLEQQNPNVFQMNVANILPGDKITVELHYTELLVPTDGEYEFSYPTVVGPRYSDKPLAQAQSNEKWVENPYLKEGQKPNYTFDIKTSLNAGMPIQKIACTSHPVDISYSGKDLAYIQLDAKEKFGGNRDYILRYQLAGGQVQSGLLLYEEENAVAMNTPGSVLEGDDNSAEKFFLLMMQPPKAPKLDQIPPREYVFIVDVSGSMNGFPLNVSKEVLRELIAKLRPTDRFNVLLFESSNQMISPESLPANPENINKAIRLIDQQRGGGGTRLLPALKTALAFKETKDFSRTFVVVTDGYVTVEREAFDLIRNNLNQANLFAFGIGSSVNRYLIEGMARAGLGEPFIVTKTGEAPLVAERFRNYIANPVLTNIQVSYQGFEVYDIAPSSIPDVFAERPIVIYGKFRGKPQGSITLTGLSGNKTYKKTIPVIKSREENNQALRYLWARKRIELLDDYTGLSPYEKDNAEHIQEVTRLGLKYNLLTAYTSFIAIDPNVRNKDGKSTTIKQPLPLPEGVSDKALGVRGQSMSNKSRRAKIKKSVPTGAYYNQSFGNGTNNPVPAPPPTLEEAEEDGTSSFDMSGVSSPAKPIPGMNALMAYLKKHLKYPKAARQAQVEGEVQLSFTVNEDGSISNIKVVKGIGAGCDEEAIRLLKASQLKNPWSPAVQNGRIVKSQQSIIITFKL